MSVNLGSSYPSKDSLRHQFLLVLQDPVKSSISGSIGTGCFRNLESFLIDFINAVFFVLNMSDYF